MKYKELSSLFYSDNKEYLNIYETRYNSESTYRFNFKIKDDNAFVLINHEILNSIEKIMELNNVLSKYMQIVPPIALQQYTRKCLIDEVRMTNEIEGVVSTRKEIREILNSTTISKKPRLYGLVKKYQLLLEEDINLSEPKDIRNLYDELVLEEVIDEDPNNVPDGVLFRADKVFVQNAVGKTIHNGSFPESKIINEIGKGLEILNDDNYSFLIRVAVFHYIFGYVHPFYDGNGRTSRFISSHLLAQKLEGLVSYKLASTIKENINMYYKSFRETNDEKNKGDLTPFVLKFFKTLIKSIEDLCSSLEENHNKFKFFAKKIKVFAGKDNRKEQILFILIQNSLFGEEGLSVETLYKIKNESISISKIRSSLKELEKDGILYINKSGNTKLYDIDLNVLGNV